MILSEAAAIAEGYGLRLTSDYELPGVDFPAIHVPVVRPRPEPRAWLDVDPPTWRWPWPCEHRGHVWADSIYCVVCGAPAIDVA